MRFSISSKSDRLLKTPITLDCDLIVLIISLRLCSFLHPAFCYWNQVNSHDFVVVGTNRF